MKNLCTILLLLLFVLSLCGCAGKIADDVTVYLGGSELYSEEDVNQAAEVVKTYFTENFPGCTMTSLRYSQVDDDPVLQDRRAVEYEEDQTMVLNSDIATGSVGVREGLEPNASYQGWVWVLARDAEGSWKVIDNGFGYDELNPTNPIPPRAPESE